MARFTPYKMDKTRRKFLCFDCVKEYIKGNKSSESKLFYINLEEEEEQELEPS